MNKSDFNIFFPYMREEAFEIMNFQPSPNDELPSLCEEANKLLETINPIDAVTGLRSSEITRLLSPSITSMEKEHILGMLQKMPKSKRNNLSDEDLINMLPSRYNSTLVDLDKVRDFYEENIFNEISDSSDVVDDGSDNGNDGNSN